MVREDIFGILRTAMQRGRNVNQAAQSLINAGYPENEVNDAVQMINAQGYPQGIFQQPQPQIPLQGQKQPIPKVMAPSGQSPQVVSVYYQPQPQLQMPFQEPFQPQPVIQKASLYGGNPKEKIGNLITILMVIALLVLVGILISVFLFKPEIMSFINNL